MVYFKLRLLTFRQIKVKGRKKNIINQYCYEKNFAF